MSTDKKETLQHIDKDSLATLVLSLKYASPEARHEDRWLARKVNFWRDIFPPGFYERLEGKTKGARLVKDYQVEELIPPYDQRNILDIRTRHFREMHVAGRVVPPLTGRFYPRRQISGEPGIPPDDARPFRLLTWDEEKKHATADCNHPLALPGANGLRFEAEVLEVAPKVSDTGGQCYLWSEQIADFGPGMQCRHQGQPTNFYENYPLERMDNGADTEFYKEARLINHVDAQASELIAAEYAQFLKPGMRVLDLMSSLYSHLPQSQDDSKDMGLHVTGLGLNAEELDANPFLNERVVQDLNATPTLPFADQSMDLALCSLSVEYLQDPLAVFAETSRVLRPGGSFLLSFSDRWFPTKVAQCWPDLHPFERMGLVLDWLMQSGFTDLWTLSIRNWWRPCDDPYFWQIRANDPVFLVGGRRP